jgi:hypothetical protein
MMDANELRALQAPLKKQHREQPATALTPARADAVRRGEKGHRAARGGENAKGRRRVGADRGRDTGPRSAEALKIGVPPGSLASIIPK